MPTSTESTLIYVDRSLTTAIAAKLIGVLRTRSGGTSARTGVNWLVSASIEEREGLSEQSDIREMLPEDLMYYVYPNVTERHDRLEPILKKMTSGTTGSLIPGDVISIRGTIAFPGLDHVGPFSPFEDVELNLPSVRFHGENCLVGELSEGGFTLPVYLPEESKFQVVYSHDQPVEVTGIVRWTPPYSPGGARALNLALRAAAVWLR